MFVTAEAVAPGERLSALADGMRAFAEHTADPARLHEALYDVESRRFLAANPAAIALHGYTLEQFLALRVTELLAPHAAPLAEAETLGTVQQGVRPHRRRDGTVLAVDVTAHTFLLGDRLSRLVVLQDVTQQRSLEEQLRQSQKMDAIGRLAGAVAHDFNNLLSVIISYSEMSLDDLVRAAARRILVHHGYRMLEANGADEALFICSSQRGEIDLLLTDVVMPRVSGPDLARQVEALRPDIRVLFMSGYTADSIVRHGVLAAETAYLQKPLTNKGLARKVRETLDGPRHRVQRAL